MAEPREVTRAAVVEEARAWLDTPYHHQGRLRGVGVDCIGLVIGVRGALGLPTLDKPLYRTYGRRPPRGRNMLHEFDEQCGSHLDAWQPGDLLVFWLNEKTHRPQHCAIVSDRGIIHAVSDPGISRVVEHGLTGEWVDRIICAYSMPGVL